MLARWGIMVNSLAALAENGFGWTVEVGQRHPGDQANVTSSQEFLGRDRPQFDDPPGDLQVGRAIIASRRELTCRLQVSLRMQDQHQGFGQFPTIEVDEKEIAGDLLGEPGIGVGGDLQNVEVQLGSSLAVDFDQPIGKTPGLDKLRLERAPIENVADARQTKDRVAMVLDQPLAALVVLLHRRCFRGIPRPQVTSSPCCCRS